MTEDVWSMLIAGKSGRVCSLKARDLHRRMWLRRLFCYLQGMRSLINLSSHWKYTYCQKPERDKWAHTATFFSSGGRTLKSFYKAFLLAPKHYPGSMGRIYQKSAGSKHLWSHCPSHHAGETWAWKIWRACRQTCFGRAAQTCDSISSFHSDSSLQKGGNSCAHSNSW